MHSLHLRKTFVCAFFIFLIANEFDKERVTCSASGMCRQYRPEPCSSYRRQRPKNLDSMPGLRKKQRPKQEKVNKGRGKKAKGRR